MSTIPLSYRHISITGGFWQPLQTLCREVTVPAVRERFEETGRFAALDFDTPWREGQKPHIFWDSDLAKWIESVAYLLQKSPNAAMEAAAERAIDLIERHQRADGYYNIYFTAVEPEQRWQDRSAHELYCAGHLMEAAVAYYEATGRDRLLNCMLKYAAHIEQVFMLEGRAAFVTCGHQEIELALVRLSRCTGDPRWLRLSKWFLDQRGANPLDRPPYDNVNQDYAQSHQPVREQRAAVGHAVRALYQYCAMADLADAYGDEALLEACKALFENITQKRMYITGGLGSTHVMEKFTYDYDLPNETAYAETCAAIAFALFCRRMSALEADSRYADAAERAIYNGFLAGLSADGKAFFYENPLELHPALRRRGERFPATRRQEVFDCSCCPPNITRFIASFADGLFSQDESTLYVHHYAAARTAHLDITTDYPRDGSIALGLRNMAGKRIALRIPAWCEAYACSAPGRLHKGYYYIDIPRDHFALTLRLELPVRLIYANPRVFENIGRVAVMRGPVVYCMEAADNGGNLRALSLGPDTGFQGGFDLLTCDGLRLEDSPALYTTARPRYKPQRLSFIPYYRFANRGESEMLVWVTCKE